MFARFFEAGLWATDYYESHDDKTVGCSDTEKRYELFCLDIARARHVAALSFTTTSITCMGLPLSRAFDSWNNQSKCIPKGVTIDSARMKSMTRSPLDGTVTLITRSVPEGKSPDHAQVFWPKDSWWVSAEPRPATESEIFRITDYALKVWFHV